MSMTAFSRAGLYRHKAGTVPLTLWRTALLFPLAFVFFFLEPLSLGPINFASAWKILALIVVLWWVLTDRRFRSTSMLVVVGGAYAFALCLNPSLLIDPLGTIASALKALYIPAILVVLTGLHRSRGLTPDGLLTFAKVISVFIAMSAVPFVAGILEPLGTGAYDLSLFGIDGQGFVGIFFSSHGASIVMSTAAGILAYSAKKARSIWTLTFYAGLALLTLYCVYDTFARTGYVMAALALIIILGFPLRLWKIVLILPLAGIVLTLALDGITENEGLMMRLRGENIYTLSSGRGGDLTSGRFRFWGAAVNSYWEGDAVEWLTGVGAHNGKGMIEDRVGLRIGSHNEFFDSLLFAGALGFVLFVLFIFYLFRMALYASRDKHAGELTLALFAAYAAQLVLQGERIFLSELIMILVLVAGTLSVNWQHAASGCGPQARSVGDAK